MATNGALASILSEDAPEVPTSADCDEQEQRLYEEQSGRQRAEVEAEAAVRRLGVAQEQWTEYLGQREGDTAALLARARQLAGFMQELAAGAGGDANAATAAGQAEKLVEELEVAAAEARASASQLRAEAERSRRGSAAQQADPSGDAAKRKRESGGRGSSRGEEEEEEEACGSGADMDEDDDGDEGGPVGGFIGPAVGPSGGGAAHDAFRERAKYIPLRLAAEERRLLRLLEAALSVSEYTDKVDIQTFRSKKGGRIQDQIRDMCAILCGLQVAQDFRQGQQLMAERNFPGRYSFFQNCFEVGRRHKIMNPEKMRTTYGKLMYLLMDSCDAEIEELLDFKCVRPLRTVYALLAERGALALLDDPGMEVATAEIRAGRGEPRYEVQRRIKLKERAREVLARKYRSSQLGEEEILRCLYSISDNNSYLLFNRDPIDRVIEYLHTYFQPGHVEPGHSLAIQGGSQGARLTHSHERQFTYCLQSLTLWREISHEMFKLWFLADSDLLREGNRYTLTNTGQGLNRVQGAPSVGRAMQTILARCQRRLGSWVGSSVVHLGDHNVPNALMFIDKYTQVPRILNPLVLVLEELPTLCRDPKVEAYVVSTFGGVEQCRKAILLDFFRHAFDGSGADNFFDAGSCIDGRLTSAWNWCSKIEKKPYYNCFKLCGFVGFDGDFK